MSKWKADGTSKLHEFVDIGVVGVVSTRRAACHRCDSCWGFQRSECANADYVGPPTELTIARENVPTGAVDRINRATRNRDALARAETAALGSVICVETHKEEQTHPWVLGRIEECVHDATTASPPYDSARDAVRLEAIKLGDPVLKVRLYEALDAASTTYFLSEIFVEVAASSVRVVDVKLAEARASARVQASS